MLKPLFVRVLITFNLCLLGLSAAQASSLNDFFAHTRNFSAHFSQSQFDADKKLIQSSHGSIQVERPDKFRLQYMKPYKQLYVADGKKLWSYDEDLEQIIVKPQTDALANSPAMVLSSLKLLQDNYQVSHQGKKKGVDWYRLTPKQNDAGFESVFLAFKNNTLTKMEMLDSFGQTTRLEFSDMKVNIRLADKTFTFIPPKGVDIIGKQ
ncbi:Outer membrane lipoprotein carrier protein LolA [hydrothermal vent metagenome]|uniref:Outer-membrane lipoprotein carrier protein n=1 Tax=hydrothermal vent metagenome TaxID=652676 RepID=A0A3B1C5X7_9ZZZZ